jgi:two-component system, NtrC family, sensor kinase
MRLGLRGQILLGLLVVFVASFPLLGVAAVQLTQRARMADQVRDAEGMARLMAAAMREAAGRETFERLAREALGHGGVVGVEVRGVTGEAPWAHGRVGEGMAASAALDGEAELRLWVRPPDAGEGAPLARLLLLYVGVTAGAILLLAYVALTYLIVRPVERVTRAAERLASGSPVRVPHGGGGEVRRLSAAFNDMAAQLRRERLALTQRLDELERTTADLEAAQDQVVRTARLASVGRLSAGVAHEIGNPLSAILGLVELLRDGDVSPAEREEFLARIHSETERIHQIIRDLLDFARRGEDDGRPARANLGQVVEDALRLLTPQKDLRRVHVERRLEADVPDVRANADRVTQIVLNLLLNAADAIEGEGSIRVEVRRDENDPSRVLLAVEDSGPGIAPEVRDHLFEPFVTTKPAGQGTGLGLAVCHTLAERAGGAIAAHNPPGGGARFEVRLPTVDTADTAADRRQRARTPLDSTG